MTKGENRTSPSRVSALFSRSAMRRSSHLERSPRRMRSRTPAWRSRATRSRIARRSIRSRHSTRSWKMKQIYLLAHILMPPFSRFVCVAYSFCMQHNKFIKGQSQQPHRPKQSWVSLEDSKFREVRGSQNLKCAHAELLHQFRPE